MGVKSVSYEVKVKVPRHRLFKALVTQSHEVLPKITSHIKNIEFEHGHASAPGCVFKTHFHEGSHFKHVKNKIDAIDNDNYIIKLTSFEGDTIGDKYEKICTVGKFEEAADGGTVVKATAEYHTKGAHEPSEAEIRGAKEQAVNLYKACEEYLIAHPEVCA